MRRIFRFLLAICFILCSDDALAQWIPLGLSDVGINLSSLAASDSEMYLGGSDAWYEDNKAFPSGLGYGVFRSTDQGHSWDPHITGLEQRSILSLGVGRSRVFAGTEDGIYASSDHGRTWSLFAWKGWQIEHIVCRGDALYVKPFNGSSIFRSYDGGLHWDTVMANYAGAGWPAAMVANDSLVVVPNAEGVWITRTGEKKSTKATEIQNSGNAAAIKDQTIFVNSSRGLSGEGVTYVSRDNGRTWDELIREMYATSMCVMDTQVFYITPWGDVGVFNLQGKNNRYLEPFGGHHPHAERMCVNSRTIVIETDDFPTRPKYRSTDGGKTWELTCESIPNITCISENGDQLFAGTERMGLYRSKLSSIRWEKCVGIPDSTITSVYCEGDKIFVGTRSGHIALSSDGGSTWTSSDKDLKWKSVYSITRWRGELVCGTRYTGSSQGAGSYRSTDNGQTWAPAEDIPNGVESLVIGDTMIWGGIGIYYSSPGGYKKAKITRTLDGQTFLVDELVKSLADGGSTLFAALTDGIYSSNDCGRNWRWISFAPYRPNALAARGAIAFYGSYELAWLAMSDIDTTIPLTDNVTYDKRINKLMIIGDDLYAGTDRTLYRRPVEGMIRQKASVGRASEKDHASRFGLVTDEGVVRVKVDSHRAVELLDVLAKPIALSDRVSFNGALELRLSGLPSGVYFLRVDGHCFRILNR
jgi:photosystem II stability/assembly factor-like uncharacterized protein